MRRVARFVVNIPGYVLGCLEAMRDGWFGTPA